MARRPDTAMVDRSVGVEPPTRMVTSWPTETADLGPPAGKRAKGLRLLALLLVAAGSLAALALDRQARAPVRELPPQGRIVYVDVVGWYGRSPAEVAARTPYELTLTGLPAGLPHAIGDWQGEDRPHDPAIDEWLERPDVVLQRTYRRDDGALLWLSLFGSRGPKSYRLFEHTPESCYHLGGWRIEELTVWSLPRTPRPLPLNLGLAQNGAQRLLFAHLYIWDSPARDPERGVVSLRLAAPVLSSPQSTLRAMADGFLAQLFPSTLTWRRF